MISPTSVSWKTHTLKDGMHLRVPVKWCLGEAHPHSLLSLAHSHTVSSKACERVVCERWMCYHKTISICSLDLPLSHMIVVMALLEGFSVVYYFVMDC